MFVVGHFHLTMAAASFMGSLAAIYFWFPKMFGRRMNESLSKVHFWWTVVFMTLLFTGQLIAGYAGQNRRLADPYEYNFIRHLLPLNRYTSYSAFILMAGQFVFVWNFIHSIFAGARAEMNPWQVGTLEWTIASPPPHHNYDVIPIVLRGPHEFADPLVRERLGRDWIGQAEPLLEQTPGTSAPTAAAGRA